MSIQYKLPNTALEPMASVFLPPTPSKALGVVDPLQYTHPFSNIVNASA